MKGEGWEGEASVKEWGGGERKKKESLREGVGEQEGHECDKEVNTGSACLF